MKKISEVFIGAVLLSTFIICCDKKDDYVIPKRNHLNIGDTEYTLASGALENYGKDADEGPLDLYNYDSFNIDLTLVSEGIVSSVDEDGEPTISGSGQIIYFEIYTSDSTCLDNGNYTFDAVSPFPVGTFDYADYTENFDTENEENESIEITSGKVTVNRTGDEYEIIIDCTNDNGVRVTGYYKGTLQYYNYDTE